MKNELGIEICGENCKGDVIPNYDCPKCGQKKCGDENCQYFAPKERLLKQRITELQAKLEKYERDEGGASFAELLHEVVMLRKQQFTKEELQFIKRAIFEYSEMSDFDYKPILDKVERILNDENNM